jgi:PST family polysaccharide transporter
MPILLGYVLFPEWFFQGIENMKYITILNICIKVFFTICIFLFIREEKDYWIYPLLQSCGFIGGGIAGQIILQKKYNLKFIILKPSVIKKTIKENFPIFINQFTPNLYNNSSTFLLGIFSSSFLVGIYDSIKKIIDLCVTLINIFSRVFFPYLNRNKNIFSKYSKFMMIIGLILTLLPIISHKYIFIYLAIDYQYAFIVLLILSLSIFFITLYDIYGLNYFIVNRKDKLVMKNTIVASVIGFIIAFPLIYWWGIIGAALTLLSSRVIMGGNLYFKYKMSLRK